MSQSLHDLHHACAPNREHMSESSGCSLTCGWRWTPQCVANRRHSAGSYDLPSIQQANLTQCGNCQTTFLFRISITDQHTLNTMSTRRSTRQDVRHTNLENRSELQIVDMQATETTSPRGSKCTTRDKSATEVADRLVK